MRRSFFAVAAAMVLTTSVAGAQEELGIKLGSKAPTAAVETLDGKPADLAQYVGKTPVLIEFWATWCGNCKQLEPALLAAHKKYGEKVKFVGVAVSVNQSPERVKAYAQRHAIPMDMYYDRKGFATDVYEVPATSYIVGIDASGKVVYTGLGGDQNIEAAIRKVLSSM
jgi:thiol-disulfide isomerase/thioredoxin